MRINTGKGTISLLTLIAIYSVPIVKSLPGLAVGPILGSLQNVFKGASDLELQMLESLPSFIIIPFVLLSGRLSMRWSEKKLLLLGMGLFVLSSVLFLLADSMTFLLVNSCLLGIGAGIVIPLAPGLVAEYFAGKRRTQQLGISSSISNLSLVLATLLAGFLADLGWRYPFLVYCLSIISFVFAFFLGPAPKGEPAKAATTAEPGDTAPIIKKWPLGLMAFYFFATLIAVIIPFNLSLYLESFHLGSSGLAGTLNSVFFLAIMFPGFILTPIIRAGKFSTNFLALALMTVGLLMFLVTHSLWLLGLGTICIGFGYGIIQPLVYDKTSDRVAPNRVTFALSLVVVMNYVAIVLYPFYIELLEKIFHTHSPYLPFIANLIATAAVAAYAFFRRRSSGIIGMKYYASLMKEEEVETDKK